MRRIFFRCTKSYLCVCVIFALIAIVNYVINMAAIAKEDASENEFNRIRQKKVLALRDSSSSPNPLTLLETKSLAAVNDGLLAGVPRMYPVYLTIGIPTLKRPKENYFFFTLDSLLNQTTPEQISEITIVVMLADRNQTVNQEVLIKIKENYRQYLEDGVLLVIKAPDTEHLFMTDSLKRTYNDSLTRVRWRAKQNLDYAALMNFCVNRSTYYLQLEDDVMTAPEYMKHLKDFVQENAQKKWAVLGLSRRGFIGKLFKNADLHKLVSLLQYFYLEQPCDFVIGYFSRQLRQKKPIIREGNLFFHKGKYSSLDNVVRRVDKHSSRYRKGYNPPATLYTTMKAYKNYFVDNAYNSSSDSFFWARDVIAGDSITVVFTTALLVERILIETGLFEENGRDIIQNATVQVGADAVVDANRKTASCTDTQSLGNFTNGRFESSSVPMTLVRCVAIIILSGQKQWAVVQEIAVIGKTQPDLRSVVTP